MGYCVLSEPGSLVVMLFFMCICRVVSGGDGWDVLRQPYVLRQANSGAESPRRDSSSGTKFVRVLISTRPNVCLACP